VEKFCMVLISVCLVTPAFADPGINLIPFYSSRVSESDVFLSDTRDEIYDDQSYYGNDWTNGYSIWGDEGLETADDFETTAYWTLEMVRFWVKAYATQDIRIDIFDDSGTGPGATVFQEEVSSTEMTWTLIDGWNSIYEVDIPVSGFNIAGVTRYWLGLQSTTGANSWWKVMDNEPDWWDNCYFYYYGIWYDSEDFFGEASACMFELHGTLESEDPEVTNTFPHDSDFPSGVPVGTNVTFHVTDDASGCDTDETTCTVEESGSPLSGALTFDDSDPLDVSFTWDPDDDYAEGTSIDVEVVTYDLAGNGPVTEDWTFTTGYVNILPTSLGVLKARFAE
jgi:hypothetical protein